MRILYVSSANSTGGGSIALLNIIKGIKEAGHEVLVATPLGDGPFLTLLAENKIKYVQLELLLSRWYKSKNPFKFLINNIKLYLEEKRSVSQLVSIIKAYNPDIVHTNVGPLSVGIRAANICGVKHVWHQREYQDLDFGIHFFPSIKCFKHLAFSNNNYNVCITKGVFNYREFREDKDRVIYDGVFSEAEIPPECIDNKGNYILYAGRIQEAKGLYDLLVAYSEFSLKHPQIRLLVAGQYSHKSPYYLKCKRFVEDNNLSALVDFLGNRNDIYNLMANAKMLVVPSKFEGFGFITVEAMLNNCIVIGHNTAGTKEQFDRGVEYLGDEIGIRYLTKEDLVAAMEKVVTTDTNEMKLRARKAVLSFYSMENSVEQLNNYYDYVMSQPYY